LFSILHPSTPSFLFPSAFPTIIFVRISRFYHISSKSHSSRSSCFIHPSNEEHVSCFHDGLLHGLIFESEVVNMFLRNVSWLSTDYTALCPRR
jgi:hypothetical protein